MKPLAKKTIEEFKKLLMDYCNEHDPNCKKYPIWLRKEFWDYWTSKNDGGRKMFYQMENKWNTGLRLATFVRRSQRDPRWPRKDGQMAGFDNQSKVYIPKRRKDGQMAGFEELYNKSSFNLNK